MQVYRGKIFSPLSGSHLEKLKKPAFLYYKDGALCVDSRTGTIIDVAPWRKGFAKEPYKDLRPQWIMPGFVDTHVHLPQLQVAGRSGLPLMTWLEKYIFPAEARFKDTKFARRCTRHFFSQLPQAGTTTAVVMATLHEEATHIAFEEAKKAHLRILMGKVLMDQNAPTFYKEERKAGISASNRLCGAWHGENNGLLHYLYTPRFAISCSRQLMEACGEEAHRRKVGTHTHLNETKDEIAATRKVHPWAKTYTEIYLKTGVIHESHLSVLAHNIYSNPRELNLLNKKRAVLAHCPSSNFALRSGATHFDFWRVYGGGKRRVGLGSDVGAGAQLSLFDVMRHASYLNQDGLNVFQLWSLATVAGATALELNTGALEKGREADFIVVNPQVVNPGGEERPLKELEETLLVLMNRASENVPVVERTYVRGKKVFESQR